MVITIVVGGVGLIACSMLSIDKHFLQRKVNYYEDTIDELREEIREMKLKRKTSIFNDSEEVESLRKKNKTLQDELAFEKSKSTYYEKLSRTKGKSESIDFSDRDIIVKAAKKAMFASHPDRNGGQDDGSFQKFNELYKKYK